MLEPPAPARVIEALRARATAGACVIVTTASVRDATSLADQLGMLTQGVFTHLPPALAHVGTSGARLRVVVAASAATEVAPVRRGTRAGVGDRVGRDGDVRGDARAPCGGLRRRQRRGSARGRARRRRGRRADGRKGRGHRVRGHAARRDPLADRRAATGHAALASAPPMPPRAPVLLRHRGRRPRPPPPPQAPAEARMTLVLARIPALRLVRRPRAGCRSSAWTLLAIVIALVGTRARRHDGRRSRHARRVRVPRASARRLRRRRRDARPLRASSRHSRRRRARRGSAQRRARVGARGDRDRRGALRRPRRARLRARARLAGSAARGRSARPRSGSARSAAARTRPIFRAGSAIGKGTMRGVLLALDWIIGGGAGVGALITPRGHVTSLLGGPLCAELVQRASSLLLVVLLARVRRSRAALVRRASPGIPAQPCVAECNGPTGAASRMC